MEGPTDSVVHYVDIDGNESQDELAGIAQDEFNNYFNFGFEVVDEEHSDSDD